MFTGIVEAVGTVERVIESGSNIDLVISSAISDELKVDQSVAHNGVCLTVVAVADGKHTVNVVKESIDKTNFSSLEEGSIVNLERSLRMGDRLDGHMVQGHVDTTVTCTQVVDQNGSWSFHFEMPERKELLVEMGSICINGVSLTIAGLTDDGFQVAIIPYTYEHTVFNSLSKGDEVNIEYDILGKYVHRMDQLQNT